MFRFKNLFSLCYVYLMGGNCNTGTCLFISCVLLTRMQGCPVLVRGPVNGTIRVYSRVGRERTELTDYFIRRPPSPSRPADARGGEHRVCAVTRAPPGGASYRGRPPDDKASAREHYRGCLPLPRLTVRGHRRRAGPGNRAQSCQVRRGKAMPGKARQGKAVRCGWV